MTMASTLTGFTLTRLQKSSVYDVVMRLPVLAWSLVLALALAVELARYWHAADPALPGAIVLNIAMRLSMIGYLVILAATVVVRTPRIGKARGAEPRISALLQLFDQRSRPFSAPGTGTRRG